MTDVESILRDVGLARAVFPPEQLRHDEAIRRAVDVTGKITPRAAAPFRTPVPYDWDPGSTARKLVKRAGRIVTLAAHCVTAPTTGDAIVALTLVYPDGGTQTIATLTIPQGQAMATTTPAVEVPAGGWLGASVTTANGASGVSIGATEEIGAS